MAGKEGDLGGLYGGGASLGGDRERGGTGGWEGDTNTNISSRTVPSDRRSRDLEPKRFAISGVLNLEALKSECGEERASGSMG